MVPSHPVHPSTHKHPRNTQRNQQARRQRLLLRRPFPRHMHPNTPPRTHDAMVRHGDSVGRERGDNVGWSCGVVVGGEEGVAVLDEGGNVGLEAGRVGYVFKGCWYEDADLR